MVNLDSRCGIKKKRLLSKLNNKNKCRLNSGSFFDNLPQMFYILDNKWRFVFTNKEVQKRLRMKADELIGKSVWELFPEGKEQKYYSEFNKAMSEKTVVTFEEFCCYTHSWYTVNAYPWNRFLKVIFTEVTHIKNLELQLLENKNKVDDILSSITDSFVALDNNYFYTHVNKAAEIFLKRPKEELIGKCIWDLYPMMINTDFYNKVQWVMKNKTSVFFEAKGVYQPHIFFEGRIFPAKDGVVIYKRDVTEQRKLRQKAELSEKQFAEAFDLSPAITAMISLEDKKYINVNDAWVNFIGYSKEEAIGTDIRELDISADEETKKLRISDVYIGPVKNRPVKYIDKCGRLKDAIISSEIIDVNGKKCVLLYALDVSELKFYEKEIVRLDKLNLIAQMAAGISHEVRNPMTTVKGYLQLLSKKEIYQADKSAFDLMISEIDRANEIITTFLSLSREESNGDYLKLQNINQIINTIYPLLSSETLNQEKEIKIETKEVPLVPLNDKEIKQLILNLFNNALDAMEKGGYVTIRTYHNDDSVVLEVSDEGKGIEPRVLANLGTPFLTTKAEGTGLGLAICYNIVKKHGGKIEVDSNNKGTTFQCFFSINSHSHLLYRNC